MIKTIIRKILSLNLFMTSLLISTSNYALPFNITTTAGTVLPTNVIPGQTATAFYTVSNNTVSVRVNNYVKYLPSNVSQVTTDASVSNLCGPNFSLNAKDTVGSSCTLELSINGPVNGNDSDPHHHLFVCFPGGMACAGTLNSLNVASVTPSPFIFSYIANFGTNTIALCSITSLGNFIGCHDSGAGAAFNTPAVLDFSPLAPYAYVTNFGGGAGTEVSLCNVNGVDGALTACVNADGDGTAIFSGPLGILINATGTFAYVANIANNTVTSCSINPTTGKLFNCIVSDQTFSAPVALVKMNGVGNHAYVSNTGAAFISLCMVNPTTGTLSNCVDANGDGSAIFNGPALMSITAADTRIYVSENGGGAGTSVKFCSINLITGKLYNCQDSGVGPIFSAPVAVTLNAANTQLYVSNNAGTTVSVCNINSNTGSLTSCVNSDGDSTAVFSAPAGVTLRR